MSTIYDIGNPNPDSGQVHKCGGVKPFNMISALPLLITGSPTVICCQHNSQLIKFSVLKNPYCFLNILSRPTTNSKI
jgi:hypothetical protein